MGKMNDRNNAAPSSGERSGEFSRLHVSARETKEELQEFLGSMRGKSPQEVLGLVAASGLTQAIVWSTIGTIIFMLFFTVMPYYAYEDTAAAAAAKKAEKAKVEAAEQAAEDAEAAKIEAEQAKSGGDKKQAAVKAMTEEFDEAKGTKADDAPDLDNLLEKID